LFHRFLARFLMGSWHEWEIPLRRSTAWWQIPVLSFSSMRWKKLVIHLQNLLSMDFLGAAQSQQIVTTASAPSCGRTLPCERPAPAPSVWSVSGGTFQPRWGEAVGRSLPRQWFILELMWDSKAVIYIYIHVCVSYVYGLYIYNIIVYILINYMWIIYIYQLIIFWLYIYIN
jgi:hypothetical protein